MSWMVLTALIAGFLPHSDAPIAGQDDDLLNRLWVDDVVVIEAAAEVGAMASC